jgi:mannose-6-phosphate isomerase
MNQLYPLKFRTIYKDKLWGGNKIKTVLGKDYGELPNCGETWEISGVEGNVSVVAEGSLQGKSLVDLIREYQGELLGEKVYEKFGDEFPLLIKFIDANQDLSIQVHPDDKLARERHDSFGKTEMWYVMQADPGAKLISGFNRKLDTDSYLDYFESGRLTEILNEEEVNTGDVFFLPAGRVHTIGKGLLIAEIQQTSDITYRIYDFDRVDAEGKKRELHVEQALEAIDYDFYEDYKTKYSRKENSPVELVSCPYFTTRKLELTRSFQSEELRDSFRILIVLDGQAELITEAGATSISMGDALLIPAALKRYQIEPKGKITLLESYI